MIVPVALAALAVRLDAPLNKRAGYAANDVQRILRDLYAFGEVEVGWRESCGTTDPTMHTHRAWVRLVKALAKEGVALTQERKSHANGWATKKGGFWSSVVYRLTPEATEEPS